MSALCPFIPSSGGKADVAALLIRARTGREQSQQTMRAVAGYSITSSARHCLRASGCRSASCDLRSSPIADGEIELGRLLDRNFARLRPAQNLIDKIGSAAKQVRNVWSVGNQRQLRASSRIGGPLRAFRQGLKDTGRSVQQVRAGHQSAVRPGWKQCRNKVTDRNRLVPPRRAGTRKKAAPARASTAPSSSASAANCVTATESLFAKAINGLLQQNRPQAAIGQEPATAKDQRAFNILTSPCNLKTPRLRACRHKEGVFDQRVGNHVWPGGRR